MQKALKFQTQVSRTIALNYLLHFPDDYESDNFKRWPLLVFLHGAGERGTNLALVSKHGPLKLVNQGRQLPFVILAPQCPERRIWDADALMALVDHVIVRFRIDPRRVYLTGLSMGGYGVWDLATSYPERFAAIGPVCGVGSAADVLLADPVKARALRSLAVWAFHGAKDDVVPVAESRMMIAAFRKAGSKKASLTVYRHLGHDSYTATYGNPKLYAWFLKHQRK
jgi:predicted peptidase